MTVTWPAAASKGTASRCVPSAVGTASGVTTRRLVSLLSTWMGTAGSVLPSPRLKTIKAVSDVPAVRGFTAPNDAVFDEKPMNGAAAARFGGPMAHSQASTHTARHSASLQRASLQHARRAGSQAAGLP